MRAAAQASLDTNDEVRNSDGVPRSGTLTVVSKRASDGAAIGLLSGHVALPFSTRDGMIRRSWDSTQDGEHFISVVDHATEAPFPALLERGAIAARADWAVALFDSGIAPELVHEATGQAAPISLHGEPLERGMGLFHWSRERQALMGGRLRSAELREVTLDLPDGKAALYRGVLVVEWSERVFSVGGDSGSLVVSRELGAIGMVLGALRSERVSYVLPVASLREPLGDDFDLFFEG